MYFDSGYAPFGESYASSGTSDIDFTGQRQDVTPGLHDFQYREYLPAQSRWSTADPAGLQSVDPGEPQSWNRYVYVANSPLDRVDPLGLCWDWDDCFDGPPALDFGFGFLPGDDYWTRIRSQLSPQVTQAIIAAITGNWRGLLDSAVGAASQDLWNRLPNPAIMDAANKDVPVPMNIWNCPDGNGHDPCANTWKQADCTISGPLKDEVTGLADTAVTTTTAGVITAKSVGASMRKAALKELSGAFTELFGIIEYGKVMPKMGYNMVAGCE